MKSDLFLFYKGLSLFKINEKNVKKLVKFYKNEQIMDKNKNILIKLLLKCFKF